MRIPHPPLHGSLILPQFAPLHWALLLLDLVPLADVKHALEPKLGAAAIKVRGRGHFKQAVAGARAVRVLQRRVAAPDQDRRGRLGQHDEMVRDLRAGVVRRGAQLLRRPELVRRRRRVAVLALQVQPLDRVARPTPDAAHEFFQQFRSPSQPQDTKVLRAVSQAFIWHPLFWYFCKRG